MDLVLNCFDFITLYSEIFQDKDNYWLYCRENPNVKLCRCLDLEELNIAMLWISDMESKIKIENNGSYIVNIFNEKNDFKNNVDIKWCTHTTVPPFIKSVSILSNPNRMKLFSMDYKCLFILLYIYRANINICRQSIVEFYLAGNSNVFCAYIKKLASEFDKSANLQEDSLKKHIKLIKKVFHLYAYENARIELFRENDEYEDDIYDGINFCGFNQSIGNTPIDKSRVKKKLDETCLYPFVKSNLNINYRIISDVSKIVQKINEKYDMGKFQSDINDIYESLENIIINEHRVGERRIEQNMQKLRGIIDL